MTTTSNPPHRGLSGAGYRPPAMVLTPWGDADSLRDRKLRPGHRLSREEVANNQRERLFAAMVAVCTDKGYEATRVADLLELSGVSRSAFYEHFEDKQACLLAAVDALVAPTIAIVSAAGKSKDETGARRALEAFIELVANQAPAARMCLVEIFAAGPPGAATIDRATDAFEVFVLEAMQSMPGRENMPPEIVRALLGGLRKVIHTRLYRGEEKELIDLVPQIWDWGISYTAPPVPLRRPRGRTRARNSDPGDFDPAERILRALAAVVAEKGYPELAVGDIAARASISLSTFYANFADKEEAMLAAVDSGSSQMLAATLPAFRRAPDWPHAVRGAFGAMFSFAAMEPEYATLGAIDVYAAGKRALEQRDQVMQGMEALLVPGYERRPDVPPIVAEAIGGAIYSMIYDQIRQRGAENMPEMAPLAAYITLAPFIGPDEACEIANGDGRGR